MTWTSIPAAGPDHDLGDLTPGLVMLVGRFGPTALALAIAGSPATPAGFSALWSGQAPYMSQAAGGTGIVIVGGAMAGGNAAATLREEGYRDRVTLIGREPGVPFGRPPLSKTYLRSEEDLTGWYVRPASWYEEHDVDRLVGSTVDVIDTAAHIVRLDSGQELPYQKVLIATGGQNRKLQLPGAS